jgi:hypothetical protein
MMDDAHHAYGEGRIGRSWRLTGEAWRVIRRDRTTLVLALAQALMAGAVTVLLFWLSGFLAHPGHSHIWLVALISYWPATFLGTFLGVALAAAAAAALRGGHLTLREAVGVAWGRVGQIALWSLLATGVGILLQEIASRLPWGGRLAAWLLGTAWSLATLFALPVLALEGCAATGCVRRSAALLRRRWGEGVTGVVTFAAWTIVAAVVICAFAAAAIGAGVSYAAAFAIEMCAIVVVSSLAGAARSVFAVALYRYAADDEVVGFGKLDLERPFSQKRRLFRRS